MQCGDEESEQHSNIFENRTRLIFRGFDRNSEMYFLTHEVITISTNTAVIMLGL